MKKRVLSLILCGILLLSSIPLTPIGDIFSIEAFAGDVTELQKVYDSAPPKSNWHLYIDTTVLEPYYKSAEKILNTELLALAYPQEDIDELAADLKSAIDNLQLHTQVISLDKSFVTVAVGGNTTLAATLNPENAADPITWSADSDCVTVEKTSAFEAFVSVKKYQSTPVIITATSNGKTASCQLTATNPLSSVKISKTSLTLFEDQSETLTASAYGLDSSAAPTGNVTYKWSSTNVGVATVDENGVINANSPGTCTIKVTATHENGDKATAECKLTVTQVIKINTLTPTTTLVSNTLHLVEGESETFKLTISPSNASIKDIKWTSSKTKIASVSDAAVSSSTASVKIKALSEGKTKITYAATDGSGVSGSFYVEVEPKITSIKLNESVKVLIYGTENASFKATVLPDNAGNQVLTWSSSDTSVCTVDKNGVLYLKSRGVCTITAKTTDGSNLSASATLRVASKAKSIILERETLALDGEEAATLKAIVTTVDGEKYNEVKWTSSDEKVATVDDKGVVTAKYPGKAVIKATTLDGTQQSATCTVTVTQKVTGVALSPLESVSTGDSITLVPAISPSYATNQKVTWSSSDESIATVDANGVVTGKVVGNVIITCTTVDGGYTAKCDVSVIVSAQGVSLNKSSLALKAGYKFQFEANVIPSSATNRQVTWSSSDESVAVISATGLLSAVAGGKCYITATTVSGSFTAKCEVTVLQDVSGIEIESTVKTMYVGQAEKIKANVLPTTATNQNIIWTSNNPNVVTATSKGELTALSKGTAIVTAKTESGGYTATCAVTVTEKVDVTGLSFDVYALRVEKGESATILATVSPDNASEKAIKWSSSNKSVATVDDNGTVKALATGETIIKAITKDGSFQQQCKVTVTQRVTGVTISADSLKIARGKTKTITATVLPSDATNKDLIWTSSDESVATVSLMGVVTAKSAGSASITATSADGTYAASCNVTVYVAVTGVELSAKSLTVPKGDKRILTANVLPSDAENKDLIWESSNTNVARVNEAGQVTGRTKGTAKITVTTSDGGYTASCTVEVVQLATSVELDFTGITLNAGKTKTLVATVKPTTASDRSVTWKSSNKSVATVSSKGVVTAVASGTANITATSGDGNAVVTCKVTVTQPATGVSLSAKSAKVAIGKTTTLTATVKPDNAYNKAVTWKSSNTAVATVSETGVVKGIKAGTAKITATTSDNKFTATCTVTVYTAVKSVKLNKTSLTLKYGSSTTITPTVSPSNATYKTVTWKSSDKDVVTVDANGKVKAVGVGYAVVTATTTQGSKTATCQINVVKPVTGVKLNKSSIRIEVGDKYTLTPTISPADASNKTISWKTSDKSVATVSSKGVVTAKKLGKTVITVTTADGSYTAKCTVNVVKKVTGVKLNYSSKTLYLNKTLTLKATVSPSDATTKTVTWSSSNTAAATVSSKGVVTAVKPGTAVITVKTTDGSYTAKCTVTVKRAVTGITLNKTTATLNSDATLTLKATIAPSNATDKTVTWKTSDKKIATVSSKGVVTPVGKGTATITATSENGLKATCKVTVYMKTTGVDFANSTSEVYAGEKLTLKYTVKPTSANNQSVTFSSSDKKVATVSSKGVVTGVAAGTAVITVKTAEGAFTSMCTVTVKQHVTSVSLDRGNITVVIGLEHKLNATVKPENATDKTYTFSSSDESIVAVENDGTIKAVGCGTATITVTTNENNKKASTKVTVIKPLEDIELITQEVTIYNRKSSLISYKVLPEDATDKEVVFSSEDENIAVVNENGLITGVSKGETNIIVKAKNNDSVIKYCKVTVLQSADYIEADKDEYVLYENESGKISAKVMPENAENTAMYWSIGDESVALVDAEGNIRALKKGETIVKVTSNQNPEAYKEIKLIVKKAVTNIEIDVTQKTIYSDESFDINATLKPEDASNLNVIWQSSDESVVKVESGKVTAVAGGEAIITAISEDNESLIAKCKVTVRQLPLEIELSMENGTINVGASEKLTAVVKPDNTYDKSLKFTSSNEKIATVDENGMVTGVAIGSAVITVTASDGKTSAEYPIKVMVLAEKVELSMNEVTLEKGSEVKLTATVLPENATEKDITWVSSDEKIATVSPEGVVTGVSGGKAVIKALTTTKDVYAQCEVTVKVSSKSIALNESASTLYLGEKLTLTATVTPEDVTNKNIIWSSSDERVATVENGVVTTLGKGVAIITAKAEDTGITATCEVNVIKHVEGVSFDTNSTTIYVGKSQSLIATITPSDAENQRLIWTTSDDKVASVVDGKVTGLASGTAVITARSEDGNKFAFCVVRVLQGINEIKLNKQEETVDMKESITLVPVILPLNADDKEIAWVSSDDSIVKVIDGVAVAQTKSGIAVVRAVSKSDESVYAQCVITVREPVSEITLSESEFTMAIGDKKTVSAEILPGNANDKAVIWTSGDDTIATVDGGTITAVGTGVVEITVTSIRYGVQAKCRVTVEALS